MAQRSIPKMTSEDLERESPKLSVVIPCHNEERFIGDSVVELVRYLTDVDWDGGNGRHWEIILVNDGSTDRTASILRDLADRYEHIRVCDYPRAGGQGMALQSGFRIAHGEWVIAFDADLDYKPTHIGEFLKVAADTGADIVVGSPYMKGGQIRNCPPLRLAMSRLANWYFRCVLNLDLSTFTAILRLYRREALNKLLLASFDKDILPEILLKADALKMLIVEAPARMNWYQGKAGRRRQNLVGTAAKALKHIEIGLVENPFFFLKYPLIGSVLLALWLSFAVIWLFTRHFRVTGAGMLADITAAFAAAFAHSPHTLIFMMVAVQTALFLTFFVFVVLQNKLKRETDFIALTRIYEAIQEELRTSTIPRQSRPRI